MEDDHRVDRLVSTPDTLAALTRNAPFVHSLKAGFIFMSYYFEGVMRYLDEQEQDEGEMGKGKGPTQPDTDSTACFESPRWLPQPSNRNHRACALPPMTRLTQLDVCFDRMYRGVQFDNAMLVNRGIRLLRPLAWLMSLNAPRMTHVTIRFADTPQALELRCLTRSLSSMTSLTHLTIYMLSPIGGADSESRLPVSMVPIIFFSLPQSVVSFKLEATASYSFDADKDERYLSTVQGGSLGDVEGADGEGEGLKGADDKNGRRSLDWADGNLVERKEPLENLKELMLASTYRGYSASQISRIMNHFPALEAWDIPTFYCDEAAKALYQIVRQNVQHRGPVGESRFLCHLSDKRPPSSCRGKNLSAIMDALPEQRVETVELYKYVDIYPEKFVPSLLRHSDVLRSIILLDVRKIESRTLATIFGQCRGLETFWAVMPKETYGQKSVELVLSHAIEKEWACTGIKNLRLTVDLTPQRYSGAHGGEVDEPQMEHYAKLTAFYTQLGKLAELEELELFVSPPPQWATKAMGATAAMGNSSLGYANSVVYVFRSLTGLLSLEGGQGDRCERFLVDSWRAEEATSCARVCSSRHCGNDQDVWSTGGRMDSRELACTGTDGVAAGEVWVDGELQDAEACGVAAQEEAWTQVVSTVTLPSP
ncbi:hypothetical protein BGZ95_001577 [Linnemannia exigua]|uniref:Uncharacterized protein n=1 Tax=Linnemannia exigua TaxID=604196 RepID=A0AAD4DKI5_9FUNG|nr:hypothetical protein BGZ95_001577 [Linnemannia exigua]